MSKNCSVLDSKISALVQDPKVAKFNDFLLTDLIQKPNVVSTKTESSEGIISSNSSQQPHNYESFKNIDGPSLPCLGDDTDFFC
jgi:hypothetical protein